jgi:hypothetical protein
MSHKSWEVSKWESDLKYSMIIRKKQKKKNFLQDNTDNTLLNSFNNLNVKVKNVGNWLWQLRFEEIKVKEVWRWGFSFQAIHCDSKAGLQLKYIAEAL